MLSDNLPAPNSYVELLSGHIRQLRRQNMCNTVIEAINRSLWLIIGVTVSFGLLFWFMNIDHKFIIILLITMLILVLTSVLSVIFVRVKPGVIEAIHGLDGLTNSHNVILNGYELACSGRTTAFAAAGNLAGYKMLADSVGLEVPVRKKPLKWPGVILILFSFCLAGISDLIEPLAVPGRAVAGDTVEAVMDLRIFESGTGSVFSGRDGRRSSQGKSQTVASDGRGDYMADGGRVLGTGQANASAGNMLPANSGDELTAANFEPAQAGQSRTTKLWGDMMSFEQDTVSAYSGHGAAGDYSSIEYGFAGLKNKEGVSEGGSQGSDRFFSGIFSRSISGGTFESNQRSSQESETISSAQRPQMTEPGPAPLRVFSMNIAKEKYLLKGLGDIGVKKDKTDLLTVTPGEIVPVYISGDKQKGVNKVFYPSMPSSELNLDVRSGNSQTPASSDYISVSRYHLPANWQKAAVRYSELLRDPIKTKQR